MALLGGADTGLGILKTAAPKLPGVLSSNPTSSYGPTAATPATAPVDYAKLLGGDYGLIQSNANIGAQGLTDQASLNAARQAALVKYGDVPASLLTSAGTTGDLTGVADDTTRGLAQQATAGGVSTVAQLAKAYDTQRQASDASLAARGILRSGAYGQHANDDLSNYNTAGYQASQQLLDYLSGLYSGYQSQQQALQQQSLQAQNDALNRIIAQINAGQIGGDNPAPTAPPAPAAVAQAPTVFDQPTPYDPGNYTPPPDIANIPIAGTEPIWYGNPIVNEPTYTPPQLAAAARVGLTPAGLKQQAKATVAKQSRY